MECHTRSANAIQVFFFYFVPSLQIVAIICFRDIHHYLLCCCFLPMILRCCILTAVMVCHSCTAYRYYTFRFQKILNVAVGWCLKLRRQWILHSQLVPYLSPTLCELYECRTCFRCCASRAYPSAADVAKDDDGAAVQQG